MAKTVNRLALQQSLVRNGVAEDPAAGNVADDWGDAIDEVTADLVTKEDLDKAVEQINHRVTEEVSTLRSAIDKGLAALRLDMETRDRERAERESEWWRLQQERDDKWRAEQQKRDEAREKRDEAREKRENDWRKEQQERDDKWREEQRKRDEAREKRDEEWRKEQRERDEAQRKRDQEAAKTTSKILWALFGSAGLIGTVVGIVVAVT